jgi:hypothetical protein
MSLPFENLNASIKEDKYPYEVIGPIFAEY